jgi:hypothetical protein
MEGILSGKSGQTWDVITGLCFCTIWKIKNAMSSGLSEISFLWLRAKIKRGSSKGAYMCISTGHKGRVRGGSTGMPPRRKRRRIRTPAAERNGTAAAENAGGEAADGQEEHAVQDGQEELAAGDAVEPTTVAEDPMVLVRVQFDWAESNSSFDTPSHDSFTILLKASCGDLLKQLRAVLVKQLESLTTQNGINAQDQITFTTTLAASDNRGGAISLADGSYGGRLRPVADFFQYPDGSGVELLVTMQLHHATGPPLAKRAKVASNQMLDYEKIIQSAERNDDGECQRIGDTEEKRSSGARIAAEFPVIAEIHRAEQKYKLWGTRACEFGDECIGGLGVSKKHKTITRRAFVFSGVYDGVTTEPELKKRLFADAFAPDTRFPELPPLSFNIFGLAVFESSYAEVAAEGVAVLRFVRHLHGQMGPLGDQLPVSIEIEVNHTTTPKNILEEVNEAVNRQEPTL